jgi:hypothetical protein
VTPTVAAIVMLGLLVMTFHVLFAFDALSLPREKGEK